MHLAHQTARRLAPLAALSLCALTGTALAQRAPAQQDNPAPIVRPRPLPQARPQIPNPSPDAPTDAAPIVRPARPARPRPIDPQSLSGATPAPAHAPIPKPANPTPATAAASTNPSTTATTSTEAAAPPKLSTSSLNRTVIVLDPGHGGADSGSRIGDNTLEKNVTLALAFRLRSLLIARGFTVVLTRDSDTGIEPNSPATHLTLDDRAGIANHAHAAACLLLHATGRGTGVHLYSSDLQPSFGEPSLTPWLTAQSSWVPASQALQRGLASALGRSHVALVASKASVRPVDSLSCPALVVELAPNDPDTPSTINDEGYQGSVAAALAGALVFWENQVQPPPRLNTGLPKTHTPVHHKPAPPKPPPAPEVQP